MISRRSFLFAAALAVLPASAGAQVEVVASVAIDNENVLPKAPIGTVVGHLTSKLSDGTACTDCTYSMVNSGQSSDGGWTAPRCRASSNNFQVVLTGPGTADLETLVGTLTTQNMGAEPATQGFPCVKAAAPSGSSYIFPFSIMVRGPTFTSFSPHTVSYDPTTALPGAILATFSTTAHGVATPAPAYTLDNDPMCAFLSQSGANLVVGANPLTNQAGICHVTAAQPGVLPAAYTTSVYISPGPYVGQGDVIPWTTWSKPYCYSAAYAQARGPVWTVIRDSDRAQLTVNCLPNGDMDGASLAAFCDPGACFEVSSADQSGHGNTMLPWASLYPYSVTANRSQVAFNAVDNTLPSWTDSNGEDRFDLTRTYNGSGSTGLLSVIALENAAAYGGQLLGFAAINATTPLVTQLGFLQKTGARIYVGPGDFKGGSSISLPAVAPVALHSLFAIINGPNSILEVDGAQVLGTLLPAKLIKPFTKGGGYGGGSDSGLIPGFGVSGVVPTPAELTLLCQIDQVHMGIGGRCT